ncbi:MAG: hypothetical protein PWQ96_1017 [Clostridia bacterium]|jgi:hypothetical protein|nr:hypothetical protein [Clostridiales bacterium]MDK2985375.1 hypothetical protein [Clostridia bacterium]
MLSMLEKLDPPFYKKFKQAVNFNEITVFSLQLSPKTAIVLTNVYAYALKKRLIGINLTRISLKAIKSVSFNGAVEIKTVLDENISLTVQRSKRDLARKAVEKLRSKLT